MTFQASRTRFCTHCPVPRVPFVGVCKRRIIIQFNYTIIIQMIQLVLLQGSLFQEFPYTSPPPLWGSLGFCCWPMRSAKRSWWGKIIIHSASHFSHRTADKRTHRNPFAATTKFTMHCFLAPECLITAHRVAVDAQKRHIYFAQQSQRAAPAEPLNLQQSFGDVCARAGRRKLPPFWAIGLLREREWVKRPRENSIV